MNAIRTLNAGTHYLCVYRTPFRINEAHDRRSAPAACNDNAEWAA